MQEKGQEKGGPGPSTGTGTGKDEDFMSRVGLASLRLDLGLVPLRAKEEARRYLQSQGAQFDGEQLVDICLEGRASDGSAALQKGFLKLRAALYLEESALPAQKAGRRPTGLMTRLSASFTARLIVFAITCFLVVLFLVLLRYKWEWFNIYDFSDSIRAFFKSG